MKSPADMKIIQIDITNACFNSCSNCTRFCGNHKKATHMDWNQFRQACESLYNFPGMVGIIGGEPTLHPHFDKFIRYYGNVFPRKTKKGAEFIASLNTPIDDILQYSNDNWREIIGRKRGLWTSFGPGYTKHYELIRDIFEFQNVNDHKNAGKHQAALITHEELGIVGDEWISLRDNCWLQNKWSATITPKGAFFCEVAGALDMLLDGPGGWPVERDWWKRTPDQFHDQLHWCEMCSFCLPVPYNLSSSNTDIVSPVWEEKLQLIGSKKKRVVFDTSKYDRKDYSVNVNNPEPYLEDRNAATRLHQETTTTLKMNKLVAVMVCVGQSDTLKKTLEYNTREFNDIVVVTTPEDQDTINVCKAYENVFAVKSEKMKHNGAVFNKGAMINDGIEFAVEKGEYRWILLTDADIVFPKNVGKQLRGRIYNPGTLYYAERVHCPQKDVEKLYQSPVETKRYAFKDPSTNRRAWGYFQLFNVNSSYLGGRLYDEDYYSAGYVDKEFRNRWPKIRRHFTGIRVIHIAHGERGINWEGK